MGNCASPCGSDRKSKYQFKVDRYDKVPEDTQKYKTMNTIKRPFSALLANLKVKKCPYKSIGVKISIDDEEYYKLGNKVGNEGQDVKWKFEKRLDFMKTDYEIRCAFLVVQVVDDDQAIVASIKINLYLICTGPYHQDFLIEFKNGKLGRISFDFKVSQLIEVSLQSLETEINLLKKHPGENFAFSIKTIVGNDTKISKPSYPVQVVLDQKLSNKNIELEKSPKLPRRRSSNNLIHQEVKQLKEGHNLLWRKLQCQQMPSINMKILLNELHHSYFQILLIKYTQTIETTPQPECEQVVIIKEELFAECYISFQKLFNKEPEIFVENEIVYEKRFIEVTSKMEIHGREFGQARLGFYMENEKYIRQMQVCVRTEEGVSKTSPVFGFDDYGQEESCKEVKELKKLNEEIELMIIKLEQCEEGYFQMKRLKAQIESYLSQMLPILEKTTKQSMILYSYANPKQLIEAQKILIEIGQKIANYVEEEDQMIGELCWVILIALIKRGEFRLSNIGFNERERSEIERGSPSKVTKRKIDVALMYQQLLYKFLKLAFQSLNWKGSESERAFAQIFCAYAYFRIPHFRNEMLNIISIESDEDVPEWRGIEFSLNQDVDYASLRDDVDSFTALFDWEHGFHRCLENTINSKADEKGENTERKADQLELNEILSNENWKYRFQKRGPAFFSFIKYWVSYVEGLIVKSKDIQWKYFPGYNRLLKVFFLQLKRRTVLQYPDSLKETAKRLIANEKIFSITVYILLKKANIYQPLSVIKVIEMISDLLSTLKTKNKTIPALFHYTHFFNAIQTIIDSEFLFMLQTTLIMLYTHYDMFHWQFRKNLSIYLLKKVFFKLFFHWSLNIRKVFHHLLIYRISHEISSQMLKQRDSTEVKKHDAALKMKDNYDSTMDELQRVVLKERKSIGKVTGSGKNLGAGKSGKKPDKQLHVNMKKKLIERKLTKAKKQLLQPKNVQQLVIEFPQSDNENNPLTTQKRRKQTLQNKPSYDQNLVQPRVDRTQSEIIQQNKVSVIYKNYRLNKKEEEVIELNKENSIKIKNQILDTTQVRDDAPSIENMVGRKVREMNPIFNVFGELSEQLVPITEAQAHYIDVTIGSFEEIKDVYTKGVMRGNLEVPKIQRQEVSVDQREIRPEKIDDW